jgi:hypothetical protein
MELCNQKGPYPHLTYTLSTLLTLQMMIAMYATMLEQLQHTMELNSKSCENSRTRTAAGIYSFSMLNLRSIVLC